MIFRLLFIGIIFFSTTLFANQDKWPTLKDSHFNSWLSRRLHEYFQGQYLCYEGINDTDIPGQYLCTTVQRNDGAPKYYFIVTLNKTGNIYSPFKIASLEQISYNDQRLSDWGIIP